MANIKKRAKTRPSPRAAKTSAKAPVKAPVKAPKSEPLSASKAPEKKNFAGGFVLILVLLALIGGIYYIYQRYSNHEAHEAEEIEIEIEDVDEAAPPPLPSLPQPLPPPPAIPAPKATNGASEEDALSSMHNNLAAMAVRIEAADRRLGELEKSALAASNLEAENAKLKERVDELEKYSQASRPGEAVALPSAIMQLRLAVDSGRSFEEELKVVAELGRRDKAIAAFAGEFSFRAKTGIRTYGELADEFAAVQDAAMRDYLAPETSGFWGKVARNLLPLVKIYRVSPPDSDHSLSATLARIHEKLKSREYDAAIAITRSLENIDASNYAKLRIFIKDIQDRGDILRRILEITAHSLKLSAANQ